MSDTKELIERLRSHESYGVRYEAADALASLLAENELLREELAAAQRDARKAKGQSNVLPYSQRY